MVIVAKLSFLLWADMWYDGGVEKFSVLAESRIWVMGERGKWIVQTAAEILSNVVDEIFFGPTAEPLRGLF